MQSCVFVALFFIVGCAALPYVVYDSENGKSSDYALCLGNEPSETLRDSLMMCRELSYQFCVNSSLIGSVLRTDSETARHFVASLSEPTTQNVERLAHLVDAALVLLYTSFSSQGNAQLNCAHEWRAWVCSRTFRRAIGGGSPLPLCASVCERAAQACDANLQCARRAEAVSADEQCVDFYRDSGQVCNAHTLDKSGGNRPQIVPVFKHYDTSSAQSTAKRRAHFPTYFLAALAVFLQPALASGSSASGSRTRRL